MQELKSVIQKEVLRKPYIDWLIVHDISKSGINIPGVNFSYIDDKENEREPFKKNQGYICLNTDTAINEFLKIILGLSQELKTNTIALANLFIVVTRASYKGDNGDSLIESFNKSQDEKVRLSIFKHLVDSLNLEYFKHIHFANERPTNVNKWLELIRSAQYTHSISDPLLSALHLVRNLRNRKLNFALVEEMNPWLRAVLIGWYGFELEISEKKLKSLYDKEKELAFLSASLIDSSEMDKTSPSWVNIDLIELFIQKYWNSIGNYLFIHVFGLSYRNKNPNKLYKKLERLIDKVLLKKLSLETPETILWIEKLKFPDDFIAFFVWLSSDQRGKVNTRLKPIIFSQFISELQRISNEIPIYANSVKSVPFNSFQLGEAKYQLALIYILSFSINAPEKDYKKFSDACHKFRVLFYGGSNSKNLAKEFSELVLLIFLSGSHLNNMDDKDFNSLNKFLKIIADTILVPYIHLTERKDEIWNPESERKIFMFDEGSYLVKNALSNIRKDKIFPQYQNFFNEIDDVKIAKWGYE